MCSPALRTKAARHPGWGLGSDGEADGSHRFRRNRRAPTPYVESPAQRKYAAVLLWPISHLTTLKETDLKFQPPAGAEYVRNWTTLTPGDRVYLVEGEATVVSGWVDTVTEDGSVLWLHMEAGAGRRLFSPAQGQLLWLLR